MTAPQPLTAARRAEIRARHKDTRRILPGCECSVCLAPADIAALLAEVERLREALEQARAEIKRVIRTLELLKGPCSNADRALAILDAALAPAAPEAATQEKPMNTSEIDRLVNRFLAWPLPTSVRSDLCATQPGPLRSGTNLLTADEARQMIEYLLAAPEAAT